jgi:acetyl/propionyl-CoA carboxylase alpha subunit
VITVASPARIDTLLIANRGEIARRIIRTCRALAISPVVAHSDADAHAPFVAEADAAVRLPGAAPADTYLRIDLLIDAARRLGAQAVHPGYGFLSENAAFAQAVIDAGLVWVGPPPSAIAAMGSKIEAKRLVRAHGVPVAPDNTVETLDDIGLPAVVKASAGGGGRGMRIVRDTAQLADAIASAEREALSAFGDGTVFVERYVEEETFVVLTDKLAFEAPAMPPGLGDHGLPIISIARFQKWLAGMAEERGLTVFSGFIMYFHGFFLIIRCLQCCKNDKIKKSTK